MSRFLLFAVVALWAAFGLPEGLPGASAPAGAVEPDEVLEDQALEARARDISKGLRCLVCQNQSIDDSPAPLARDLRLLVRERLVAGDSDGEIIDFIVARYGDFVLLRPPMKPKTYGLWYGPAILFALGLIGVALYYARRRRAGAAAELAPLSDEERRRLEELLEDRGEG
jgi:cytochrome c-type biogenesis protein CcmH